MARQALRLMSSFICRRSLCTIVIPASVQVSSDAAEVSCPVNSYNEWDPLEEIIVGRAEGQRIPFLHPDLQVAMKASAIFCYVHCCLKYFDTVGWVLERAPSL